MKSQPIPDELFRETFRGTWGSRDLNSIQSWIDVVDDVHAHPVSKIRATLDVTEHMVRRITPLLTRTVEYTEQYMDIVAFVSDFRGAFWHYAFGIPLELTYQYTSWDVESYEEDLQSLLRSAHGLEPIQSLWQLKTLRGFMRNEGIRAVNGFHEIIMVKSESGLSVPVVVPRTGYHEIIKRHLATSHVPCYNSVASYAVLPDNTPSKDFYTNLIEELCK